jgi:chromate transporter
MTSAPRPDTVASAIQATEPAPAVPTSLTDLFLSFNRLALQGFGGVLPVAQRELVERKRWLSNERFVEMLSIAQVLPGPNIINLILMIGDSFFGLRGAFAALAGMLLSPLVIVMGLAALYGEFARLPMVNGALTGMGAVAAGLIISTGLKLMKSLRKSPLGLPVALGLAGLTFVVIGLMRLPLLWLLAALAPIAIALAWRKLP